MNIIEITNDKGEIMAPEWLPRAEHVHCQLRPQIEDDYVKQMSRIFSDGGRMCVVTHDDRVLGVAVYRTYRNTFCGSRFYIDDLITDETQRSRGVGRLLLTFLESKARKMGCKSFDLDSGTQRTQAHKFYFREGLTIGSFSFRKSLI